MSGVGSREPGAGGEPASIPDWDDLILVGIVARTHGNKGHVIVNPHTDFMDDRFRVGARFQVRMADGSRRTVQVTAARIHQGRPVIGLEGVGNISDAERYQGAELRIRAEEQPALPPGHYYHHQLVGCEAVDPTGERIGRVVGVEGEMGQSRLIVAGERRRHEIPLAEEICTVDLAERRIVVRAPEGLLDL